MTNIFNKLPQRGLEKHVGILDGEGAEHLKSLDGFAGKFLEAVYTRLHSINDFDNPPTTPTRARAIQ